MTKKEQGGETALPAIVIYLKAEHGIDTGELSIEEWNRIHSPERKPHVYEHLIRDKDDTAV